MFELIKKIINSDTGEAEVTEQDALTAHLALTVLLLEAAHSDGECSEEEQAHLMTTLVTHFGISRNEIDTILKNSHKERKEHVNLFRYTHFLNQNFSEKQKIDIMESVWRIILLDDHLEAHEDHFAHKLAKLLHLSHADLIQAKLSARKQLS